MYYLSRKIWCLSNNNLAEKKLRKNRKYLLSMCDVKVFLTFTFVVRILQVTRGCWWFTLDVPPSSLNLVLLWQLFYLFCSSIVINTCFNPPFLWKCLYQVSVITVFTVFRLLTDFACLYTYEFWLSLWKIVRSTVILLLPLLAKWSETW